MFIVAIVLLVVIVMMINGKSITRKQHKAKCGFIPAFGKFKEGISDIRVNTYVVSLLGYGLNVQLIVSGTLPGPVKKLTIQLHGINVSISALGKTVKSFMIPISNVFRESWKNRTESGLGPSDKEARESLNRKWAIKATERKEEMVIECEICKEYHGALSSARYKCMDKLVNSSRLSLMIYLMHGPVKKMLVRHVCLECAETYFE